MAIARQSLPSVGLELLRFTKRFRFAMAATILAALCGMAAFVWLVMRDHAHPNVMLNEQSAPASLKDTARPTSALSSAPSSGVLDKSAQTPSPVEPIQPGKKYDFTVGRTAGFVELGPVKVKLGTTDLTKDLYDVYVIVGHRWSPHKHIKVNEPLWISANRGANRIEMVVTSLKAEAISGYWMESNGSTHLSPRIRARHRRNL